MAKVCYGIPTYKRELDAGILPATHVMTGGKHKMTMLTSIDTSACCMRFNAFLIMAQQLYAQGKADYFLLWHSDIVPEAHFIDVMVDIAEEKGAEILSAVVPIKDQNGLTSTALDEPVGDMPPEWRVRRLTMTEINARPETFTESNLLVNTGLILIKLSAPWLKDIHFHFDDAIIEHHGQRLAVLFPEDWMFSRDARKLGCTSQWVTRAVKLTHVGHQQFPNYGVWGKETDAAPPTPPDVMKAVTAATKVPGWMSWNELARVAENAKGARCVVELGSWKGRSTKAIAMQAAGKVYAVDSWRGSSEGDETGKEATAKGAAAIKSEFYDNVATPHKNVVVVDVEHAFAGTALKHLAGEVDFAFIDGDHAYEHVKRDILTCLDLMAPGGLLSGHDFNEAGVEKAVRELLPDAVLVGETSIWEYRVPAAAPTKLVDSSEGCFAAQCDGGAAVEATKP